MPSNWKFGAENFLGDTYHNVSHRSVDLVGIGPSALSGAKGRRDDQNPERPGYLGEYPQGHGIHSAMRPEEN